MHWLIFTLRTSNIWRCHFSRLGNLPLPTASRYSSKMVSANDLGLADVLKWQTGAVVVSILSEVAATAH